MAEVFKCVDDAGHASYRDTSCDPTQTPAPIDERFVNNLSMGFTAKDAAIIAKLAQQAEKASAERAAGHTARLQELTQQRAEKAKRCAALKTAVDELQIKQRRYGRSDADAEADLIRHMREACSG